LWGKLLQIGSLSGEERWGVSERRKREGCIAASRNEEKAAATCRTPERADKEEGLSYYFNRGGQ